MLVKPINIVFIMFLILSCKEDKNKTVKPIEISFTKEGELAFLKENDTIIKIDIELAESDYEQQTGLMHRHEMEMKQGMLFIYKDERPRPTFYMKNTQIPLDLIYINTNQEVVEINKNAQPYDETPISAAKPAKYVLEVNAGFVDNYSISEGLKITFKKL